jgi:dihydrofolate synthase/folylpolyglutamate synthase
VTLRGRFQTLATAPELIVDVAHNPEAARALASVLRRAPRRTLADVGMLADKDIAGTLATLVPEIAAWWTITPDSPRACTAAELAASLQALGAGEVVAADDYASALAAARSAARAGDRILAFGSFYTVAAALSHAAAQP